MKRNVKRLALNRETLRYLDGEDMSVVAGGVTERICRVTETCFCPVLTNVTCGNSCPTWCPGTYCCAG